MATEIPQHTPGPWSVEDPMDHELMILESGKEAYEWRTIAGCPWPTERGDISRRQVEANAHLMAAAPDMLAALQGVMDILGSAESNASGNPEWDYVAPRVAAARAAVALATPSGLGRD